MPEHPSLTPDTLIHIHEPSCALPRQGAPSPTTERVRPISHRHLPTAHLHSTRHRNHVHVHASATQVALALESAVYVPGDRPEARRLWVIFKGTVKYDGTTLGPGRTFGERDALLTGPDVVYLRASCKTYVHCNFCCAEELFRIAADFPQAKKNMNRSVLREAFKRFMFRLAHHPQRSSITIDNLSEVMTLSPGHEWGDTHNEDGSEKQTGPSAAALAVSYEDLVNSNRELAATVRALAASVARMEARAASADQPSRGGNNSRAMARKLEA
jgi:hypothetical protein